MDWGSYGSFRLNVLNYSTDGEIRNTQKILAGMPEVKRPLGRHRHRWMVILILIFGECGVGIHTA
jgi:hypothetical protein